MQGVVSRLHKLLPQSFPIFNAGDGVGEHPTQALLDLFAIEEEFPGRLTDWKKEVSLHSSQFSFQLILIASIPVHSV